MLKFDEQSLERWNKMDVRSAFSTSLLEAAKEHPEIYVLTADLAATCRLSEFQRLFPRRFFNMGIAEGAMVSVAAGLSATQKTVFATTFAFCAMRAAEQIRTDICYGRANVKFAGFSSGVSNGILGNSHYALEDIGLLRSFSGLTIFEPSDNLEILQTVEYAATHPGPVYFRMTGATLPPIHDASYRFTFGQPECVRPGSDAVIFACGAMVWQALQAAELLERESACSAAVYSVPTLKPLSLDGLTADLRKAKLVVSVEEHNVVGGLGTIVSEFLGACGHMPPALRLGLPDAYGPIGSYEEQLDRYGLTARQIAQRITETLRTSS